MVYIVHRKVRGRYYRYLVESYRNEQGQPRQKNKCFGVVPELPEDAPIGVVLFAGGGGIEAGMVMAGIRPVLSVEEDSTKPDLSRALAQANHLNFKPYGSKVIKLSVEDCAALGFPNFPRNPDYLHASPMCSNFSKRKINRKEELADQRSAIATAQAISALQPRTFTLENVAEYRDSESWYYLEHTLKIQGYKIIDGILDTADLGIPQNRKRFWVKATLDQIPSFPAPENWVGWYEAITDLIPNLPSSKLPASKKSALEKQLRHFPHVKALLIQHTGGHQIKNPDEPCWTITRSVFTDHKGNNRSNFADVWLPDGTVKALNLEAIARLQGFPSWYVFPEQMSIAGSIVGYSVPPLMMPPLLHQRSE